LKEFRVYLIYFNRDEPAAVSVPFKKGIGRITAKTQASSGFQTIILLNGRCSG
jgi:hypothetical protein